MPPEAWGAVGTPPGAWGTGASAPSPASGGGWAAASAGTRLSALSNRHLPVMISQPMRLQQIRGSDIYIIYRYDILICEDRLVMQRLE